LASCISLLKKRGNIFYPPGFFLLCNLIILCQNLGQLGEGGWEVEYCEKDWIFFLKYSIWEKKRKGEYFVYLFLKFKIYKALFSWAYNFTKGGGGKTTRCPPIFQEGNPTSPRSAASACICFEKIHPVSVLVKRCVGEQDW